MQQHLRSIPHCGTGDGRPAEDADAILQTLEAQAWQEFFTIRNGLDIPPSDPALDRFLTGSIIPGFSRLGFDDKLTRALIGLAAGAWNRPARSADNVVGLHPAMRTDLEEVRQGLLIQADKKMAPDAAPTFLSPQDSYEIVRQTMDPANLHQLFDEITTPWIILPRAHGLLREDQAHYLPAYLEMIEKETNEEALHIFTRIAIEFLANYAIRFSDARKPPERVTQLVIAGYEAMYWKSLHTPPEGLEDVRVFEHFLSWMKYSDSHSNIPGLDKDAIVRNMETHRQHIFVDRSSSHTGHRPHTDKMQFVVALRHGCLGIACCLSNFAGAPPVRGIPFDQGMAWGARLFDLKSLFDLLVLRYGTESRRTRYYIRDFIFQLQNAFALTLHGDGGRTPGGAPCPDTVRAKIAAMIHQLQHTLAATGTS